MLKELLESRKSYRTKATNPVKPTGVINMDFASLYPSTMTMRFPSKQFTRKKKIKNIFDEGI
jgi:hypothetical protein